MPLSADIAPMGVVAAISLACIGGGLVLAGNEARLGRRLRNIDPAADAAPARRGRWSMARLLALTHGLTLPGSDREEVQRGLRAAGYYSSRAVAVFGAARLGAAILAALGSIALLVAAGRWSGPIRFMLPATAAGVTAILAKVVLGSLAKRRARAINAEMPFTLDVLQMMLESGVSLDQSFRTFAGAEGRAAPTVRRTVASLVDDLQRGMAYDLALGRWADRLGVPGARELANVFRQALANGAEMTGALRQFSQEFTETRVTAARESIGQKTVQMTVAMMVLLMPALFILIAGPGVSSALQTLGSIHR